MSLSNLAAFVRQHPPAYAIVHGSTVIMFLPYTRTTPEGLEAAGVDVVGVTTYQEARRELGY